MARGFISFLACSATLALANVAPAHAQSKKVTPVAMSSANRTIAWERAAFFDMASNDIQFSIDTGRIAPSTGDGGLVGAIILASKDEVRRGQMQLNLMDKAEETAQPLRRMLRNYGIRPKLSTTVSSGLSKVNWLRAMPMTVISEESKQLPHDLVKAATTKQVVLVSARYELSPDFTQVRVISQIAVHNKSTPKASPLLRQVVASVVQLRDRSLEPTTNVKNWSADDAKRARMALDIAILDMETLIPAALNLTQSDMEKYDHKDSEKAYGAGFNGALIARATDGGDGMTIWSKGLIHIRSIP